MRRAERREVNQRAHAIRREFTDRDHAELRQAGASVSWGAVWATYAGMSNADVLRLVVAAPVAPVAEVAPVGRKRRTAPPHVTEARRMFSEAREVWEAGLEEAMAGGRRDGRPARGEKYTDEERDYRDENPAPLFRDFLAAVNADRRAMRESEAA